MNKIDSLLDILRKIYEILRYLQHQQSMRKALGIPSI